ncbi:uncharacterized protein TRIADDRAFT_20426 [Trichoplax adhaerens]|uniref:Uncharacterized protein n=1 Tax=Trichoplax adhaerens TaxID=10228 RepID=B3RNS4_TRIAD|nr:hypothetical protein TRIADDRAFT_20426 [Trichoplax adhaerens]EDV27513.1 hypothetical protein TRIADDRAFT_20426 [Trichoplax adhaerens]|eukprot:XP_002109347.1 hypothetical protein TRIADDRAFT_20426 [Trichoplax adhaerens]
MPGNRFFWACSCILLGLIVQCFAHSHGDSTVKRQVSGNVWMEALLSTALISAAPFLILFLIPISGKSSEQAPLLKVLLSFASGGLLGDAFLHLIPHAVSPHHSHDSDAGHDHHHHHGHDHAGHGGHDHGHGGHDHVHAMPLSVGLWVLAGVLTFFIVEKFVRNIKGGHHHHHQNGAHGGHDQNSASNTSQSTQKENSTLRKRKTNKDDAKDASKSKSVSGFLNLAADFTHNFTDGLAIGASYLAGQKIGIITTITILFHEVPHEIGDFAILVQSGCSKRKAMFLQLSTATGAMAGTVVGLLADVVGNAATTWILPFTAGGFIYIATVTVIPELLDDCKPWQTFKEVIALLIGIAFMIVIALYE